jgi:hypothetical protein
MLDCFIILFGVMMAWACAWKAHHYFNLEEYIRSATYIVVVIILLVIVFAEALRVTP